MTDLFAEYLANYNGPHHSPIIGNEDLHTPHPTVERCGGLGLDAIHSAGTGYFPLLIGSPA
jgi:hypothetical protein